jgi:hypothetical protein
MRRVIYPVAKDPNEHPVRGTISAQYVLELDLEEAGDAGKLESLRRLYIPQT